MHEILSEQKIDQPRYAVLDREHPESNGTFPFHDLTIPVFNCFSEGQIVETEDSIEIGKLNFAKPFVEKPVNAEDHNVYIYFPISAGGGSQRLFRKVRPISTSLYIIILPLPFPSNQ